MTTPTTRNREDQILDEIEEAIRLAINALDNCVAALERTRAKLAHPSTDSWIV